MKFITTFLLTAGLFMEAIASFKFKDAGVALEGFNPAQEKIIKETFEYIETLSPGEVKISRKAYEHFTRFSELFKFDFSGADLRRWISSRAKILAYENTWTTATSDGNGTITIGEEFLKSTVLERAYILVHEARHSDRNTISHVVCPAEFQFISVSNPDSIAAGKRACDSIRDGAYAFQAAFLFEIYARHLGDYRAAGNLYNASVARMLNNSRENEARPRGETKSHPPEFSQQAEIVKRLNAYDAFTFQKDTSTLTGDTYYSEIYYPKQEMLIRYRLNFYVNRDIALRMFREQQFSGYPVFVIGSIVVHCQSGDPNSISEKLQIILRGMQILP